MKQIIGQMPDKASHLKRSKVHSVFSLCRIDHDLQRFAIVHGSIPVGNFVKTDNAIEHAAWLNEAVEY